MTNRGKNNQTIEHECNKADEIQEILEAVKTIDKKLFRSNGEISIMERIRNIEDKAISHAETCETKFNAHLKEHNKRWADWKYIITTGLAIGGLIYALAKPAETDKIEKIEKVLEIIQKQK